MWIPVGFSSVRTTGSPHKAGMTAERTFRRCHPNPVRISRVDLVFLDEFLCFSRISGSSDIKLPPPVVPFSVFEVERGARCRSVRVKALQAKPDSNELDPVIQSRSEGRYHCDERAIGNGLRSSAKCAARSPSGVRSKNSPESHRSGGARKAFTLRYLFKVILRQKRTALRPGCFSWQWWIRLPDRRLNVAIPATRPPEPHRSTRDYGSQDHYHRTCQDTYVTCASQPTPDLFPSKGRSPGKPGEQAREKYTGSGEGRG